MKKMPLALSLLSVSMVLLALMSSANGMTETTTCINSSYLQSQITLNVSGSLTTVVETPIPCTYGCQNNIGRYGADCASNPYVLPVGFYAGILIFSVILLGLGVWRKHYIFTFVPAVLFIMLAFASFNVDMGGQSSTMLIMVYMNWFGAFVSFVFTLVGMLDSLKSRRARRNGQL